VAHRFGHADAGVFVARDIPGHDHAAAITAQMRRYEALSDSAKRFEFLVTEAALRWAPGSTKLLAAQHAKLQSRDLAEELA
jgi:hypothetical protein